jgi:hypothetical protein
MPIVQTANGTLASDVTLRVRALINDMLNGNPIGDIFADSLPHTIQFVNAGIDYINNAFIDASVENNTNEAELINVPANANITDPNAQTSINYLGCNNGAKNFVAPSLPLDLKEPIKMWCKLNDSTQPYTVITCAPDGLDPNYINQNLGGLHWNWYGQTLYLNGTSLAIDLKIRYIRQILNIKNLTQYIPINGGLDALAYATAYKFEDSLGSPLADKFKAQADSCINCLINGSSRRKDRLVCHRQWHR